MNWDKLKFMLCPVCSGFIKENVKHTGYKCNCGFFITTGKFDAVVNKVYKTGGRHIEDPDKNLSELNNL